MYENSPNHNRATKGENTSYCRATLSFSLSVSLPARIFCVSSFIFTAIKWAFQQHQATHRVPPTATLEGLKWMVFLDIKVFMFVCVCAMLVLSDEQMFSLLLQRDCWYMNGIILRLLYSCFAHRLNDFCLVCCIFQLLDLV